MKSAHVIYISPKMQTARDALCFSDLAGRPAVRRLADRLRKAFGSCWMLCHEDSTARLLEGEQVTVSARPPRYPALADFAREHGLDWMALYPDTAVCPDCEGVARMIELHERNAAAVTVADRYPIGLYPEILSRGFLERFARSDSTLAARMLAERANRASWSDPPCPVNDYMAAEPPAQVLEKTGANLLLLSGYMAAAASKAVSDGQGMEAAYAFGAELRRQRPVVRRRVEGRRAKVLYVTLAAYYAGAEESLTLLAAGVDRTRYQPEALLFRPSLVSDKLAEGGVPVTFAPCDFGRMTSEAVAFIDSFLDRNQLDLLHIDGYSIPYLTLSAQRRGIPVIQHIRILHGRHAADGFQLADRAIAISDACRLDMLRSGLAPERVVRVYNGLDMERFRPRERAPGEPFTLVSAGRICEQKRQHFLAAALERLLPRIPDCRVVFAGECHPSHVSYLENLRAEACRRGIADRIRFTGFEEKIEQLYAAADASVLCSTDEAFGRVLIESMAMGVPVVAAASGGVPEVVEHGLSGLLFDPYSLDSFVEAIARIHSDSELRACLRAGGLARAAQFTLENHVRNVERVYEGLIPNHGPNAV